MITKMFSSQNLRRLSTSPSHFLHFYTFNPATLSSSLPTTIVYIPGFKSTFYNATKSSRLLSLAKSLSLPFLTFDHFGHGVSSGSLVDDPTCSIGRFYKDAELLLEQVTSNQLILVGASMGFWISLLLKTRSCSTLKARIKGVVGLGASYNFTDRWLTEIPDKQNRADPLYIYHRPSLYSPTGFYDIPVSFLLNSRPFLISDDTLSSPGCPIMLVHGMRDVDVPYGSMLKMAEKADARKVVLLPKGDHRLSEKEELEEVMNIILDMVKLVEKSLC